jgi:DNA-binding MarR family transcriptional regulator
MNSILASFSDEANAPSDDSDTEITSEHISAILRARRLRDKFFDRHLNLFADPAWDMLLDLMAHRLAGQRVAVSSLCIAAHVPATTALRWIKLLTAHGLLVRVADPQDGRRVFIELSDYAAAQLSAYLKALRHYQALVV